MRRLLTMLVSMVLATAVPAQQTVPGEQPEVRRYTVELIVFEYAESVSVGTEVFPPDDFPTEPEVPVFEDEFLSNPESDPDVEESVAEPEFILLVEDEFTLNDVRRRMERLDVYDPILHVAWTQETHPQESTSAIDLASLVEPPEGLEGSFTLYLSRYLHLVVDLAMDPAAASGQPVAVDNPVASYDDARVGYDVLPPTVPGRVRFRIQEDRIFKNGDIRYFDHPKFGVLAKITRVEDEEPSSDELLGHIRE